MTMERRKRGTPTALEVTQPTARVVAPGKPAHVQHMVFTPADRAVVAVLSTAFGSPGAPSVDARVTRVFEGRLGV